MVIDFLSIRKIGDYWVCEIAPVTQQQNYGSFVICSVAIVDLEPQSGIMGTINGATIMLTADGKSLPYRLRIGNKSINQLRLWQLGYHIPHTVVLDFSVCDQFKRDGDVNLRDIYEQVVTPRLGASAVAIRCSSNLEDGDAQSFAGTFDTYLAVPSQLDEIQGKIVQSYRKFCLGNDGLEDTVQYHVQLGIMIQQMVQPKFSGFLFTLDPVNPPSDWLKIEYWQGPREKSEGSSITLNRETGKQVRSNRDSKQAPLPMTIQGRLHRAAVGLELHFGIPQDVEFLISGADDALYLMQSRPITAFSYSPTKCASMNSRSYLTFSTKIGNSITRIRCCPAPIFRSYLPVRSLWVIRSSNMALQAPLSLREVSASANPDSAMPSLIPAMGLTYSTLSRTKPGPTSSSMLSRFGYQASVNASISTSLSNTTLSR